MQETSQKSSNVPKERRDKKHLVLVCRLTLAFSRPLLGKGELHETAPFFFCVTNDAMLTMR